MPVRSSRRPSGRGTSAVADKTSKADQKAADAKKADSAALDADTAKRLIALDRSAHNQRRGGSK